MWLKAKPNALWGNILMGLTSLLIYSYLAYFLNRQDFWTYGAGFATLSFFYLYQISPLLGGSPMASSLCRRLLLWATLYRLIMLAALPQLSDDYYRFYWDGLLLSSGHNPYLHLPRDLIEKPQPGLPVMDTELFALLNSPDYYTVYPPVNQAIFALGAGIFPHTIQGAVWLMRLVLILADLAIFGMGMVILTYLGRDPAWVLLYALNPLVILELTGNLHFEGLVLALGMASFYFALNLRASASFASSKLSFSGPSLLLASIFYALAISTKLIPLIFLPVLGWALARSWEGSWLSRWSRVAVVYALVGFFTVLTFLPFLDLASLANQGKSVALYFGSFEFNASIYYLVRAWGYWVYGYNIIAQAGRVLSFLNLFGILLLSWLPKRLLAWSLPERMLLIISLHYFMSTTVHPWYIIYPLLLSLFTPFRYALVWSLVVSLSYSAYRHADYQENLYAVALEYLLVFGFLFWDILRRNNTRLHSATP